MSRPRIRGWATQVTWCTVGLLITLGLLCPGVGAAAPGDLDEGFAGDGVKIFPRSVSAESLAAQPDGGLLVAATRGRERGRGSEASLVRYLPSGSLDRRFGVDGHAAVLPAALGGVSSDGQAVVLAGDRRILVGGSVKLARGQEPPIPGFVSRLLPDGSLDPTFGSEGTVLLSDPFVELIRDGLGRIVIATCCDTVTGVPEGDTVARLLEDGSPDLSFGPGGSTKVPLRIDTMTAASDDGVLMAGYSTQFDPAHEGLRLARLTEAGELDTGFGSDGSVDLVVPLPAVQDVNSLAVDASGRVLVGVQGCTGAVLGPGIKSRCASAALRFSALGVRDASFGDDGYLGGLDGAELAIDEEGRIAVAGRARVSGGPNNAFPIGFAISLFDGTGTPVIDFGTNGTAYAYSALAGGFPSAVATTAADRTVVLGDGNDGRDRLLVLDGAAARHDRDADLRRDDRDRCRFFASRSRDGCPKAWRRVWAKRRPHGGIRVTIHSLLDACERGQRVVLKRARHGPDEVVDRKRTHARDGHVLFAGGLKRGRYYAQLNEQFASRFAHCKGAHSARVRLR